MLKFAFICSAAVLLAAVPALADDWTVTKLRGGVFSWNGTSWDQLERGSVVSDDRLIKSSPKGRATLVRSAETIEVGPDTSIQIQDKSGFTTVYNHEGVVGIDAEARNVQHFAVETRFMAAVVKGTAFTVRTDDAGSLVAVTRGNVEVDDSRFGTTVNIEAGQAISSGDRPISVEAITPVPADLPAPPPPAAAVASATPAALNSAAVLPAAAPAATALSSGSQNEPGRGGSTSTNGNGGGNNNGSNGTGNANAGPGNNSGKGQGNASNGSGNGNSANSQSDDDDKKPKDPKEPKAPKKSKDPKEPKEPKDKKKDDD